MWVRTTWRGLTFQNVTIPAGATEMVLTFTSITFNNNDSVLVQLRTSGGIEGSGYVGNSALLQNSVVPPCCCLRQDNQHRFGRLGRVWNNAFYRLECLGLKPRRDDE